jgi:hypothetical protein
MILLIPNRPNPYNPFDKTRYYSILKKKKTFYMLFEWVTQRTFIFEEIREDIAAKYMTDTKWLPNKVDIILDIDEDFYG